MLPPLLPGGLPFIGHAYEFWRRPVELLVQGQTRFGDVWSLNLAGTRATVLTGPQANEAFFRAPEDVLSARECYQFTVPVFGPGVAYDVPADEMDRQLSFVHPALTEKRLRLYVQVMVEETDRYLSTWGDTGERDLFTATQDITIFIATRCLLGDEIRRHFSTEFARLYHDLDGGMTLLAYFMPHAPLPAFRRRDRAREAVYELLAGIMAARRSNGAAPHQDFLSTLMAYRDERGRPLPDNVIVGLLLTLIFAGQHTSAVLAAWTGILLHQHPSFLPAILEEQLQEIGGEGITYESLRRLPALERSIKEAERLRPPLIMLLRSVLQPLRVNGFELPARSLAVGSPAISHRLRTTYSAPDRYDPDRFAPGHEEDKAPYSLIGFGGGKHRCIGMVFAYQQIKVIWTSILRRYEIELVEREYRPDYRTLVVGPRQPCRIRYRTRRIGYRTRSAGL
jgi:sterol 14-demethylase